MTCEEELKGRNKRTKSKLQTGEIHRFLLQHSLLPEQHVLVRRQRRSGGGRRSEEVARGVGAGDIGAGAVTSGDARVVVDILLLFRRYVDHLAAEKKKTQKKKEKKVPPEAI